MKTITSRDNPEYRKAKKLLRRKYREETGLYLLEGIKPVKDALETGAFINKIFLREGGSQRELGEDILDQEDIILLAGDIFDELSDTQTTQGVIAQVRRKEQDREGFTHRTGKGNILVLDRLQDPGNVGTMIRTAEAAGFTGIIALKGTSDIYAPKVVRAAAGSILRMPIMTGLTEDQALETVRTGGWKLAVTSAEDGQDCFKLEEEGRFALVIGNEGAGISEELLRRAQIRLMIPMEGKIESLNAAVAAGILMYQLRNTI